MHLAMYFIGIKEPNVFLDDKVIERIPLYLKYKYAYRNALIISDSNIVKIGLINSLITNLKKEGFNYVIFDDVVPNPTISNINDAKEVYIKNNCDFIIAIGGGSVIDVAKVVGALIANPDKDVKKLKGLLKVSKKHPLTIAIPTTAGTGSEATVASVIVDDKTREKFTINDPDLIPTIAVLDQNLIKGLPTHLLVTTAIDALTHSVEAYIGKSRTKKTKEYAIKSIKLIFDNLDKFIDNRDDINAGSNLILASYYAGVAFTRSYVGYVHSLSHALSGKYNCAHGFTNSILLPIVLKYYGENVYSRISVLAKACFSETSNMNNKEATDLFINKIERILEKYNIKNNFKEVVKIEDIDDMVDHAYKEANPLYPVPKILNKKQLKEIYIILISGSEE